jgi:hypothetical protein
MMLTQYLCYRFHGVRSSSRNGSRLGGYTAGRRGCQSFAGSGGRSRYVVSGPLSRPAGYLIRLGQRYRHLFLVSRTD